MSRRDFLVRRIGWAVFVVWVVITGMFLALVAAPDHNLSILQYGLPPDEARRVAEQYRERMHYDEPLLRRYAHWLWELGTFQFGRSYVQGRPVNAILAPALRLTLLYLVPGVALASLAGVLGGLAASLWRGTVGRVASAFGHLGAAFPAFLLAEALALLAAGEAGAIARWNPDVGAFGGSNPTVLAIAVGVVATTLGATLLQYAAAETDSVAGTPFVKRLRANGAPPRRIAAHVLRNAAPPLVALFSIRVLAVLLLGVYLVEAALGIPGFGEVTLTAIRDRDIAVVLAATLITTLLGVFGTLVEDVVTVTIDPRSGSE
ncbi:ABC transporter permease [Halobaculum magnesiiphilum]|uniref:ABC transporter permease n=1 Tax=Halobaculum magnesiiphilum TaxID=1017351 RepID=A0A8T8WBM1_9EURY|nr:ABC transporter permease [Halobaculum magnesiiphilum]QZP37143.1 ABC transporter permease [Halobaculum magnesiiphilum]